MKITNINKKTATRFNKQTKNLAIRIKQFVQCTLLFSVSKRKLYNEKSKYQQELSILDDIFMLVNEQTRK